MPLCLYEDVMRKRDCIQLYIFLEKHLRNRKSWCIISKKHRENTFFWKVFPGKSSVMCTNFSEDERRVLRWDTLMK